MRQGGRGKECSRGGRQVVREGKWRQAVSVSE